MILNPVRYHYGMAIEDCFEKFPLTPSPTHRSYGYDGYSVVSLSVALGEEQQVIRNKKLSLDRNDPKVTERLTAIHDISQEMCSRNGVDFLGMMPLDHGKGGVVVDVNPEYVIRMQKGVSPERPDVPCVLPAVEYLYNSEIDVTFELLEKVDVDCSFDEAQRMKTVARQFGIEFWDVTDRNVGRKKDGQVVIIDPDAFSVTKPKAPAPGTR